MPEDIVGSGSPAGDSGSAPVDSGTPQPTPGSSGKAPMGAVPVSPARTAGPGSGGSAVDITDDTLIRIPGQAQPIKYSEFIRRQQADYTRKTQEVAKQRREFEQRQQAWDAQRQQQEQHLQTLSAQLMAGRSGQVDPGDQALEAIAKMPAVTGPVMAQIVQAQREAFKGLQSAFEARDEIAQRLYNQIQEIRQQLGMQLQERAEQGFDQKIDGWLKQLDYPAEYKEFAKEVYLAYEPSAELDEEFPAILQRRVEAVEKANRLREARRVEEARNQRFPVPGRGGNGVAGKPLALSGRESARELADMLWDPLQADGRT